MVRGPVRSAVEPGTEARADRVWLDLLPLTAVVLGWVLRLYFLDEQSLWYDEGTSATVAPRDMPTILANAAADIHPPLYYLLLHFWVGLAGITEFALRFPSVLAGTLTLAVTYRLARDLIGPGVGNLSALLLAAAPLPIWYSQEARMYALATAMGALATLLLSRNLRQPSVGGWAVYSAALTSTLYSHYFAAAIGLAHAVTVAIWYFGARKGRRPAVLSWAVAASVAGLAFLPWLIRTYGQLTGWPATSLPFSLADLVWRVLGLFGHGQGGESLASALPIGVAVVLGALWLGLRTRRSGSGAAVLLPYLIVPLLAMYLISLRRPFFHPKFVLLVAPAADVLAAAGIVAFASAVGRLRASAGRAIMVLAVLGFVAWRMVGVWSQWQDPGLARDDYRGLVATIEQQGEPGDALVVNAPGQVEIVGHYYRGTLPIYPLPRERPIDQDRTAGELAQLAGSHQRIWAVFWATAESDPSGFVERWLDERMYKASHRWFGGVRLALYVNPAATDREPMRFSPAASFGDVALLRSVEIVPVEARPGAVLPVSLEWVARRPSDVPYTVFVHLLGPQEYLWGQRDSQPVGGARPTTSWRTDQVVVDRRGLPILPGTPPGEYHVEIGMYRADTGARLPISDGAGRPAGDRLLVGPITVRPGSIGAEPEMRHPLPVDFGPVRLLGYDLHPVGRDDAPPEVARGEIAALTLHWRATDHIDRPPRRLILELARGAEVVASEEMAVTLDRHPPERWSPGELVRDPYKLTTDALPPGTYAVWLQLRDAAGEHLPARPGHQAGRVQLGTVTVR